MAKTTPLMEQYNSIKSKSRDSILFFRMGDFYEMFYDDAVTASKVLGLTLTSRAHGKDVEKVPLAGFPYHAVDVYLSKMLKAGYRVAICEQVEDPKTAKGIVKRAIVEKISPGTTYSEKILEEKSNNFLGSVYLKDNCCGISAIDISTGDFLIAEGSVKDMMGRLEMFNPSEVILPESLEIEIKSKLNIFPLFSPLDDYIFSYDYSYETLINHFNTSSLKGFGCENMKFALSSAGAVLHYLMKIQVKKLEHINRIQPIFSSKYMILDNSTRINLEIVSSMSEKGKETTLLSVLDYTETPMGGRTLNFWILNPLRDLDEINKRHSAVEEISIKEGIRGRLLSELKGIGDVERLQTKICTGRANAKDLIYLLNALKKIPAIKNVIKELNFCYFKEIYDNLIDLAEIADEIERAIVPEPPLQITDGGIIKNGYNDELDDLRKIAFSGKKWIADLQNQERKRMGINSLKVNYNRVFGYYIEITRTNLSKVPPDYIRKQTLVNAERFITPELKEYEEKVLNAEEKIKSLEYDIFQKLRNKISIETRKIQNNARQIGILDCFCSLSTAANVNNYNRPSINNESKIYIEGGRHAVVEKLLPPGEQFVSNDLSIDLDEEQIHIITGPNMAGKSTFIRQVGLIVLMAQMGSFVPSKTAVIGIVDRIFTRVGATDNVARGESTFLVEMNELANILNNATPKSLILLDEIGRGTSTFDGLSIAWAAAEYLHDCPKVAAKTLFATHYHELTEMERIFPRIKNYNVIVKEWGDSIIFIRKVERGGCDHSYGIQVAKMAGIPKEIIERAKEILNNLEANELTPDEYPKLAMNENERQKAKNYQINLFSIDDSLIINELKKIEPDKLSPLDALNKLFKLKKMIK